MLRYALAVAIGTSLLMSCVEEPIGPLREDEDDIIIIPPPPPPHPPK